MTLLYRSIITCFRENTLKLVHFRVFGNLGQIMESIGIYWNFISRFVGETAWNQNITPQWLDALWLMANTYQHEPPWLDRAPSLLGCTLGRLDWAKKPRVESIGAIGCNAIRSSSKCRWIWCQVEVRLVCFSECNTDATLRFLRKLWLWDEHNDRGPRRTIPYMGENRLFRFQIARSSVPP